MERILLSALVVLLLVAGVVAMAFGFVKLEQIVYVVKMIAGWTAWTAFVAVVYAGCERLFPDLLCAPAAEES
jgi:hypothetical protein